MRLSHYVAPLLLGYFRRQSFLMVYAFWPVGEDGKSLFFSWPGPRAGALEAGLEAIRGCRGAIAAAVVTPYRLLRK